MVHQMVELGELQTMKDAIEILRKTPRYSVSGEDAEENIAIAQQLVRARLSRLLIAPVVLAGVLMSM